MTFANPFDNLKIHSDHLTIQKDTSMATFSGNVIVHFEDAILTTSKLIVYYTSINNSQKITKIVIPGKLKALKDCGKEIIIADEGMFNNVKKQLTLKGNVTSQTEDNILITDKLIYSSSLTKRGNYAK
ncbi:MAG: LptA/OstA family protein [Rickettsiaceae bacterium]|nr:LptA/OstA family protein [Rickettsiaceae bacterium]